MSQIPKKFNVTFTDVAQYAQCGVAVMQFHLMIDFSGHISENRLKKALRLSLDAEPALGCRLVPRFFKPFWERLSKEELDETDLLRIHKGNGSQPKERFMEEPLDVLKGPQLKCLLIRSSTQDHLVAKVNHFIPDAAGVKDWTRILGTIYTRLESNPDFTPEPNLNSRELQQVYGHFNIFRMISLLPGFLIQALGFIIQKPIRFPSKKGKTGDCTFVLRRFTREQITSLKIYQAATGATMNDIMVAALMRALLRVEAPSESGVLKLAQTIDLRRYLPSGRADGVCHLSSGFYPEIKRDETESYHDTLKKVKKSIDKSKSNHFGLCYMWCLWNLFRFMPFGLKYFLMKQMWRSMISKGNMPIVFTNMGAISPDELCFGGTAVTHAELIMPAAKPPAFFLGMSGFQNTLTLGIGFWESAIDRNDMETFFDMIESELPLDYKGP